MQIPDDNVTIDKDHKVKSDDNPNGEPLLVMKQLQLLKFAAGPIVTAFTIPLTRIMVQIIKQIF